MQIYTIDNAMVAAMEALGISMEAFAIAAMREALGMSHMVRKHQTTEIERSSGPSRSHDWTGEVEKLPKTVTIEPL